MIEPFLGTAVYFEESTALARVRGNRALLLKLLHLFLASEEIPQFAAAMDEGDSDTAGRMIHAIKGVAGNLSLMALYEVAQTLESCLNAEGDCAALYLQYREILAKTRVEVQNYLHLNPSV